MIYWLAAARVVAEAHGRDARANTRRGEFAQLEKTFVPGSANVGEPAAAKK
jgi:hypothetical protein